MIDWFAENALPIWVGGAIALTMAVVVYLQTRTNGALVAIGVIVAITASLLTVEWLLETPREAVERTLYELAARVEANDVAGTLSYIAPSAAMRTEVETLMPLVNIERARIMGTPQIEMDSGSAVVRCRGFILATVKRTGMKGGAEDELSLEFVLRDGRWWLQDYTSNRNWQRALGRPAA